MKHLFCSAIQISYITLICKNDTNMAYVILFIINLVLGILSLYVFYKILLLVKGKLGWLYSIIIFLGIMGFSNSANSVDENVIPGTNQLKSFDLKKKYAPQVSTYSERIKIADNIISEYDLSVVYEKDSLTLNPIPISGISSTNGMSSGTKWVPHYINLEKTSDPKIFSYHVVGSVKWSLGGLNFYVSSSEYTGVIKLK